MFPSKRFALRPEQSPTHHNLHHQLLAQGWAVSPFNWYAGFNTSNLDFHPQAAQHLEYKHLLAQLVTQHCPDIMPTSYCIDDDNWVDILNQLSPAHVWILKPSLLNNGQHIKLFQSRQALADHYCTNQRLGGMHVLQRYIDKPHLLRDDRKYSIRVFVILTNYDGAYIYRQGYFNVAMHPYQINEINDLRPHLTNEHLQNDETNVIQIPSQRFDFFASQLIQIKYSITEVLYALQQYFPLAFQTKSKRQMAIFGFDFMADQEGRLWLLEANHGPCFPIDPHHPLQTHLYQAFWQALIGSFVEPIAGRRKLASINYAGFDRLM